MKFSFAWCFFWMVWDGFFLALNKSTGLVQYFLIFAVIYFSIRVGQMIVSIYVSGELEKITKHYGKT